MIVDNQKEQLHEAKKEHHAVVSAKVKRHNKVECKIKDLHEWIGEMVDMVLDYWSETRAAMHDKACIE